MNKIEHIIIIDFPTKEEAMASFEELGFGFSFSVEESKFFNILGESITEPESYEKHKFNNIKVSNKIDPLPGELYVENGFLKYYKEI
jgi:hypothetical protein